MEPRVATIKQRPSSRCYSSVSDMNVSDWEWQGSVCVELAILRVWGHGPHKGVSLQGLGAQLLPGAGTPARPPWVLREATGQVPTAGARSLGVGLVQRLSPQVLWFAVPVRTAGDRRDDAHRAWEPEGPVSGPPSRYDAKAEIHR